MEEVFKRWPGRLDEISTLFRHRGYMNGPEWLGLLSDISGSSIGLWQTLAGLLL